MDSLKQILFNFFMIEKLKVILSDLLLVYKNFIHWNISKILITIFGFFLGIVLSLPFFITLSLFIYFDPISWGEVFSNYFSTGALSMSLMAEVYNNVGLLIGEGIILILGVVFFIFGYSFKNIMITDLYLKYINGLKEKIKQTEVIILILTILIIILLVGLSFLVLKSSPTIYFSLGVLIFLLSIIDIILVMYLINFKKLFSYLKLLFLIILILFIPVIIFIIAFFILLYSFGGAENVFQLMNTAGPNLFSILLLSIALICLLTFIYLAYRLSFSYIILIDTKNYSEKSGISFYIKESFRITAGLKIFKFLLLMILFSIFMIPFDYLGTFIENRHEAIVLAYGFLIFLTIGGLFEMYIVSIYRNVMLSYKELGEENTAINEKEKEENITKEEIL